MNDSTAISETTENDLQMIEELQRVRTTVFDQVGKVIVGHQDVIDQILVAMFSSGHVLLVGVPGLAKTLLVKTLAESLALEFSRIQFTPDLMPSDITGIEVIQQDKVTGVRELRFHQGPVFANMILADEINRTPPKTQAAMLEAMQEHQVTVGGQKHRLTAPFVVLATQNPIEQEGTYPLPEALLDRFMIQVQIGYPDEMDELEIVRRNTSESGQQIESILDAEKILGFAELVRRIPIADHIALYALRLARLTRLGQTHPAGDDLTSAIPGLDKKLHQDVVEYVKSYVRWGAGPRASQYLVLASKARAVLHGNTLVTHDDVRAIAGPVLRHRIRMNFLAGAEQTNSDDVIQRLIQYLDQVDDNAQSGIDKKLFRSPNAG